MSVRDLAVPGTTTDVPIVLTGTTFSDDYEGDYQSSRRTLAYTLDFNIKAQFAGQKATSKTIKTVTTKLLDVTLFADGASGALDQVRVRLGNVATDTPDNYTTVTTFGFV